MTEPDSVPSGWYVDPKDDARWRYWNGEGWTHDTAPIHQEASPAPESPAEAVPVADDPPVDLAPAAPASAPVPFTPVPAPAPAATPPAPTAAAPTSPVASTAPPPRKPAPIRRLPDRPVAVQGWWLLLTVAGIGFINLFVPIVSIDGEPVYGFRDSFDEFAWSQAWPVIVACGLLAVAAISAHSGRPGWLAVSAGAISVGLAITMAAFGFTMELLVGFADFGNLDVQPHLGFFLTIGLIVASVAVVSMAVGGAFQRERGTVPAWLSLTISACAAWVFVVLAQDYFANETPLWNSDFFWINLVTIALFVPLAIVVALPMFTMNADAAGFAAGYSFPLATVYLIAILADDSNGQVGVTDSGGIGIALLALFAFSSAATALFGRRLVRDGGTRRTTEVHAPQPSIAWFAVGLAFVVLIVTAGAE